MKRHFFVLFFLVGLLPMAYAYAGPGDAVAVGAGNAVAVGKPSGVVAKPSMNALDFSIPCLDNGVVKNAKEADVCKAILPKCSEVKSQLETVLKDSLSLKIWGYYNRKDIDLNKSTVSNLVGEETSTAICSVVGHDLKKNNMTEVDQQSIGSKESCGEPPRVTGKVYGAGIGKGGLTFNIGFEAKRGSQWVAYMKGAYPWALRRAAYDVMNPIKPDLSNLDKAFSEETLKALAPLFENMRAYVKAISAESKTVCSKPNADLISDCKNGKISPTDPAHKICTLVKSQLLATGSAIPNLLVGEVSKKAQEIYDQKVAIVLTGQSADYEAMKKKCSSWVLDRKKVNLLLPGSFVYEMKPYTNRLVSACAASCMFNGKPMHGKADHSVDPAASGTGWYNCKVGGAASKISFPHDGMSAATGFAGVMEKIIRFDICDQKNGENKCESPLIASKPEEK